MITKKFRVKNEFYSQKVSCFTYPIWTELQLDGLMRREINRDFLLTS